MSDKPKLARTHFSTSRMMDFFSESALITEIGYEPNLWPLVVTKELVDNALDEAERNDGAPAIKVTLGPDLITVSDNGTGIPAHVIERLLDYTIRVSDKKHYVATTRGQLGNALKCIIAAPFVATKVGLVEIIARGLVHRIEVSLDRIAGSPVIEHTPKPSTVKSGTVVKVHWPNLASYKGGYGHQFFYREQDLAQALLLLIADYSALNRHASFQFNDQRFPASDPSWTKWSADDPTSPHWYQAEHLRALIAAHINGADRFVRDFVGEFAGLSGTVVRKTVLAEAGISAGKRLSDFVVKGDIDMKLVERLLAAMRRHSRPVEPKRLGIIGKDHIEAAFKRMKAEGFKYFQQSDLADEQGLPCLVEIGFAMRTDEVERRRLILGINWAPIFKVPSGAMSEALNNCRVQSNDPVILLIHMARPRWGFLDHGKGSISE
jgi:DNA topoisomerase VI subunit B